MTKLLILALFIYSSHTLALDCNPTQGGGGGSSWLLDISLDYNYCAASSYKNSQINEITFNKATYRPKDLKELIEIKNYYIKNIDSKDSPNPRIVFLRKDQQKVAPDFILQFFSSSSTSTAQVKFCNSDVKSLNAEGCAGQEVVTSAQVLLGNFVEMSLSDDEGRYSELAKKVHQLKP